MHNYIHLVGPILQDTIIIIMSEASCAWNCDNDNDTTRGGASFLFFYWKACYPSVIAAASTDRVSRWTNRYEMNLQLHRS